MFLGIHGLYSYLCAALFEILGFTFGFNAGVAAGISGIMVLDLTLSALFV